ncbi:glycosyltransferase family 4 protein [Mycetocola reblochoni]|uniref:D-inositol 3-phosphate glycosyltransferase n=2 Tax=Mycetocola reblochoni TaxID=331618 RepID=A0A1R4K7V5_9MICO|nr:glycosyltransferase family 4 protein [Mycetocola reblochoni]RLP67831.1 glycosyltransferase [Mycetocola reblochoni]SJN40410.1 Glycosyl transferase, group 1 [Mycetocola reblochoni REB411]
MHILISTDQNVSSLGGVQVSIRLQQRYLRAAGHRVSVVAPRSFTGAEPDADDILLPAVPITGDREYAASWPGASAVRRLDRELAGRPPVDLVHVQGDYWGAVLGYRFAARHGIPAVLTAHNNLDSGIRQVLPFPGVAIRGLLLAQRALLRPRRSRVRASAAAILNEYALRSAAVTAPSGHFARLLERTGAASGVQVVWNGVDDAVIDEILSGAPRPGARAESRRPVFLWTGRMSQEKRFLEFLDAVAAADLDAEYRVYGQGLLLSQGRERVAAMERAGSRSTVRFLGKVGYRESLQRIRDADALVQTSIGFETQGMTVFEAAALGTASIVSDPNIAAELPDGACTRPADGSVSALADALAEAEARIRSGRWLRVPAMASERVLQSRQTERMLEVYRSALAAD